MCHFAACGRTSTSGIVPAPASLPPTAGQVNGRIWVDDDTLNALLQLAWSQDGAVSDAVLDALSRHLATS